MKYLYQTAVLLIIFCYKFCNKCLYSYYTVIDEKMVDQVVVVTGGCTGAGYYIARELARKGAKTVLGCDSQEKGEAAQARIIRETQNKLVEYRMLDLGSVWSIKRFADITLFQEDQLDVLIHTVVYAKFNDSIVHDMFRYPMQVNHLGPSLLTLLLMPLLLRPFPSRVLFAIPAAHKLGNISMPDYTLLPDMGSGITQQLDARVQMYYNSLLANLLFANYLSTFLKCRRVTVNSYDPGQINEGECAKENVLSELFNYFEKSHTATALMPIYLAVSPSLSRTTGQYFANCGPVDTIAYDRSTAFSVFKFTQDLVIALLYNTLGDDYYWEDYEDYIFDRLSEADIEECDDEDMDNEEDLDYVPPAYEIRI